MTLSLQTSGDMANGKNREVVVPSSGNVFTDLGLNNAGEKQTRVRLAVASIRSLRRAV
jgi:hypothetical protein